MVCPKCGHKQNAHHAECVKCGVIFSKVKEREKKPKSLEKARNPISKKEFEDAARSEFNKLDATGSKDPIKTENRERSGSIGLNAGTDVQAQTPNKWSGTPGNRTFKIVFCGDKK